MELELAGRRALVTGATRGIGRAIAFALAREGCTVAILARDRVQVGETVAELRALAPESWGGAVDVAATGELERFVVDAGERFGGLEHLVVNVGDSFGPDGTAAADDDWRRTFEVNVLHAVRAVRACVPLLREAEGASIALVASISGSRPGRDGHYSASKAAEIALAHSLAQELSTDRIRVNAISPGSIDFGGGYWRQVAEAEPQRFAAFLERDLPWGRLGTPAEVADVVAFLLSPRASWINGANIAVDGAQQRAGMT